MKLSAMIVLSVLSFSASANSIRDYLQFSNMPTASKDYFKAVESDSEVNAVEAEMKAECLKDKAAAEAFIVKTKSEIFSSTGCQVHVQPSYVTQGGSAPNKITTHFQILFK